MNMSNSNENKSKLDKPVNKSLPILGTTYFDEYAALLVKFGRALKPRIDCVSNNFSC